MASFSGDDKAAKYTQPESNLPTRDIRQDNLVFQQQSFSKQPPFISQTPAKPAAKTVPAEHACSGDAPAVSSDVRRVKSMMTELELM
ncbi:hypothetical protein BaRGS_00030295 [Batillaria attramentaria]|uniref:Uncharacterized protein n=1 Tax=Batillaria attramentaria TaxID=370345 RepID=A0ABD0JUT7_9CAEN